MADLVSLQNLLTFTRDGEWGKGEAAHDLVKMAVIRGTDFSAVRHGDFSSVPVRYIPKKAADRKMLRPGDILIETAGGTKDQPTGRTVYLNQRVFDALEMPVMCASFARFLRVNAEMVDPKYLFWYLQSIYATGEMFPYHIQHTGVARFQYTDFAAQWRVPVPDKGRQLAIAELLGSLDDKIELNRRMNETLERIAQAIFRDWFVDFGPTRRKIDGATDPVEIMGGLVADPGRARELVGLFPARIGDDGLPEGWLIGKVGDIIDIFDSKRIPLSAREREARKGPYPYHGATGIMDYVDNYLFDEPLLLLGEDGSVAQSDGFPYTQYVWEKIWVNNHAHVLRGSGISTEQLKLFFDQTYIIPFVTGAVQPKLNQRNLTAIPFLRAGGKVHKAFDDFIEPIFSVVRARTEETRTLAATRDLLLPKLMSGEIRLRDAEREIEAVA